MMTKPLLAILRLLPLVSSCGVQPKVTASGGRAVVVRAAIPDIGVEQALPLAEAECQKQGKSARAQKITSPSSNKYIFECVY